MPDLNDRVVLVTGGGRGLGAATAEVLADSGATVVVADVSLASADTVAARLAGKGRRAVPKYLDVTDEASVSQVVKELEAELGRLDGVVNSAGIDLTVPVEELPLDMWDKILDVNLRGPFLIARAVFPVMREAGGGCIVHICSTASKRAWANASAYHASKWGLLGFSHALHVEGRPLGIKVTALIPGGMRTPFLLDRFPDIDLDVLQEPHNVAEAIRFVLTQPPATVIPEIMVLPMKETSWP